MKTKYTIPVMVSTAVLLAACGGGSDVTSSLAAAKFNLTGTVPGTLIEAFCEDGSYYSVNSDQNGTTKHPFTLALPKDLSCRLVMTTNEGNITEKVVTPITFTDKNGVTSIAFTGTEDTDLGHVDLALSRDTMTLDVEGDGVEDDPKNIDVEDPSIEVIEKAAGEDPLDKNDDDIIDIYEDDDGDGINNHDDDDDDNDGVKDINDSDYDNDHDGDGIDNKNDIDDDNDKIEDKDDDDDDNDGIKDELDGDSDHYDDDDDRDDDDDDNQNNNGTIDPTVVTTISAGRLLSAQCAQCHRTDANPNKGFEDLIGEDIYGELSEMKRENKIELMHLQANGYSAEQIRLMDEYFKNLSANNGGGI